MALSLVLGQSPLDSWAFGLDGADGTLAIRGRDILVELDAYDIGDDVLTTFYFGTRGYSDPTAPDYYAPRISQALNLRRDIYAAQTTGGASRVSYGETRLTNNDGGLDFLRDYALAGQRVRFLIGDVTEAYGTFEPLLVGRVQRVLFEAREVAIILRDRLQDFQQPVQQHKYLGTNVLPDGLEGVNADDIKDRPKPLLYGSVQNIAPPCVNTSKLIYQISDGPITTAQVYDNGAALTPGADYASEADMMANAPTAGTFRLWLGGGYFRLGAVPAGTVTCDAADAAAADNTAARVALRIASRPPETGEGGVLEEDVTADDVTDLDAANASQVGIWLSGGESYSSALDAILISVGAWYGFDRTGMFRMQRLELPVSPYVLTLRLASLASPMAVDEFNIVDWRMVPSNDPEKGQPSWRISLDFGRNYTVQQASVLAGVVTNARRNFLVLEYRTREREDTTVQTAYPFAVEKKVTTLLLDTDDAREEADRLLDIFSEPRDFMEVDAILTSDLTSLIDIGSVVNIVLPRFGYEDGKIMRILGMGYNAAAGTVTLALWG